MTMEAPRSAWLSDWGPWLAAAGLAAERLFKLWSDYRNRRGEDEKARTLDGDSIFRRASELMDRYEKKIASQDEEIERLRDEVASLQQRIFVLEGAKSAKAPSSS